MNYRHIYHAGNFADVFKHAVLARLVTYLKGKEKAFRVVDTHAGTGFYDLHSQAAQKTGEWQNGIGRLMEATPDTQAAHLLAPYLDAVRAFNPAGGITRYPGSPAVVRHLLRRQDRLTAIELHEEDGAVLREHFSGDHQVRVIALDGWLALGAHLPPKEKRGLVLVDPPFEVPGEFSRMSEGLLQAHRRWPGGTYCLWYPLKADGASRAFHADLKASGIAKISCVEHWVRDLATPTGLNGSGLIVVNPPFTLADELAAFMPALTETLRQDQKAGYRHFQISGENP